MIEDVRFSITDAKISRDPLIPPAASLGVSQHNVSLKEETGAVGMKN
jgi:hypothetical protein